MRMVYAPLLLAVGCGSDYDLNKGAGHDGTTDDENDSGPLTDTDVSDICPSLEGEPHDVALNTECDVDLQTGSFTPVIEFDFGNSSFCGPPAIGQIVDSNGSGAIDDDDMPAIVVYQGGTQGSQSGKVVAVKGDNSGIYWQSATGMGQDGGFAIGDLNDDGWPEVIAAGNSTVHALDGQDGSTLWTSPSIGRALDPMGYSYPSIADMNGDGHPEITVGNAILSGKDGSLKGMGREGIGAAPYGGSGASMYGAMSVPIDLDGDGEMELVTGNAAYSIDGSVKWKNSKLDGLVAVADFDGDGEGEIVKTSGIYVTAMDSDGTELWTKTYSGNLGAPSIDDLDNDGEPDIVFAAQNYLIALNWAGKEKWKARISDQSGAAGPVFFDFELDGYPEVLFGDETSIQFFSGLDGSVKFRSTDHKSYTILETPVVADVDNDGEVEIVLGHCGDGYSNFTSFSVYGDANHSWPQGRKIWNQHAYTITNVGDQGSIPTGAANNWPEYNSFRSGDAGRPPGEYVDLQAEIFDICEDECGDGSVAIGAWVLNAGNLDAPSGIAVSLRKGSKGPILATQYTTSEIKSGETGEMLVFELAAADLDDKEPVIEADYDEDGVGAVFECDESNNQFSHGDGVCE